MLFNKFSPFRSMTAARHMRGKKPAGSNGVHVNVMAGPLSRPGSRGKRDHATLAGSVSDRPQASGGDPSHSLQPRQY